MSTESFDSMPLGPLEGPAAFGEMDRLAHEMDKLGLGLGRWARLRRALFGASEAAIEERSAAMEMAARENQPECWEALARSGCLEEDARRSAMMAASAGHEMALRAVIKHAGGYPGAGALAAAALARRGASASVDALLAAGPTQSEIRAALVEASSHLGVGELKALVGAMEESRETADALGLALKSAAGAGNGPCVEELLKRDLGPWDLAAALKQAARYGRVEPVEALIARGALSPDSEALWLAAGAGSVACVKALIPGSDPGARGSRALEAALEAESEESVDALLPFASLKDALAIRSSLERSIESGMSQVDQSPGWRAFERLIGDQKERLEVSEQMGEVKAARRSGPRI